jgi:glycosyltransferase involved in cell wall biosynthesis
LAALTDWRPDLIYTHKLSSPELEAATLKIAPAIFFAHDYHGTCISGAKTHKFPVVRPCRRRFGPMCLLHYFPNRCGGLNPITMVKLYDVQSKRQSLLHRYRAIVTHSQHMLTELLKHGLSPATTYSFPFYVAGSGLNFDRLEESSARQLTSSLPANSFLDQAKSPGLDDKTYVQLIFSGRMEELKGGHVLLEALPEVQRRLGKIVRVVFAGDGRERSAWQTRAQRLQRRHSDIEIEFVGWLDEAQLDLRLEQSDLMVVPSLWPEPFGLAGPEAGLRGVPVAAFAVGGVPEWLLDGVNGYLAPGDPPTSKGLAEAIVNCLAHAGVHAGLRRGAARLAHQFNNENHLANLLGVFNRVISQEQIRIAGVPAPI